MNCHIQIVAFQDAMPGFEWARTFMYSPMGGIEIDWLGMLGIRLRAFMVDRGLDALQEAEQNGPNKCRAPRAHPQ